MSVAYVIARLSPDSRGNLNLSHVLCLKSNLGMNLLVLRSFSGAGCLPFFDSEILNLKFEIRPPAPYDFFKSFQMPIMRIVRFCRHNKFTFHRRNHIGVIARRRSLPLRRQPRQSQSILCNVLKKWNNLQSSFVRRVLLVRYVRTVRYLSLRGD